MMTARQVLAMLAVGAVLAWWRYEPPLPAESDPVVRTILARDLAFAGWPGTEDERVERALALGLDDVHPVVQRHRALRDQRRALGPPRVGEAVGQELWQVELRRERPLHLFEGVDWVSVDDLRGRLGDDAVRDLASAPAQAWVELDTPMGAVQARRMGTKTLMAAGLPVQGAR